MTLRTVVAASVIVLSTGLASAQMMIETGVAPGTYGEELEDWALLQECIFEEEVPYCSLTSRGFTYFLNWENPTPGYVLDALGTLNVNDPIWLQADIVGMGDMSAEIAVTALRHEPELDRFSEDRGFLQGAWVRSDNPGDRTYVMGTVVEESLNGEFSMEYVMQLADSCDASGGRGPVLIAHIDPWNEPPCLLIHALDSEVLIVELAGGDGALYKYVRP